MDKRVIFAVAGSGKTTHIVSGLDLERRFLLVTYADNNRSNLRRKIIERFGYFPSNIVLLSYFTFLHSFCFKPFLLLQMRTKGINYDGPPNPTSRIRGQNGRLSSDHFANLAKGLHYRSALFAYFSAAISAAISAVTSAAWGW